MMLVIPTDYGKAAPDAMPDMKEVELMMKFNESLKSAGVLLDLNGLHPPSAGTRVSYKNGKATVVDGPFTEVKECIGGYWIIQVKSKEEAIQWASRVPFLGEATVEVRQIHEMTEFPPEIQEQAKSVGVMK
jgi:hypothetical protein